jgi:ribosomal protein S27AE
MLLEGAWIMPIENNLLHVKLPRTRKETPLPAPDYCPKCGALRHVVIVGTKPKLYCGNCGYTSKPPKDIPVVVPLCPSAVSTKANGGSQQDTAQSTREPAT